MALGENVLRGVKDEECTSLLKGPLSWSRSRVDLPKLEEIQCTSSSFEFGSITIDSGGMRCV